MKRTICVLVSAAIILCTGTIYGAETADQSIPDLETITTLDLKTAQRIALAANPTMDTAMARVEQAKARVDQAMATWWPSLDVVGNGNRVKMSDTEYERTQALYSLYGQSVDQTIENYALGLQASWTLFDGFYRSFSQQQAKYGEQSVIESRQNARRLLAAAVAEAFFNAQLAKTQVTINGADSEFYSQQLRDAQNRYDVGAGPWGDVLNIKVQLNSAKTGLMLSGREYEAALYGLAALLGIPEAKLPEDIQLVELDTEVADNGVVEQSKVLIEEALANRPDIKALDMQVKSAEALIGMTESLYYPRLLAVGSINGARLDDPGFTGDDFGNTIGLNLSWNLFAGGADKARRVEAKQAKRSADNALLDLRNQVVAEVRQGITLLEAAREQVRLQRESVKLVEENRDLAKHEYEAGEASLVRLNEAQRDLTRTYSRLAQAVVSFHRANQRLLTAVGRTVEE